MSVRNGFSGPECPECGSIRTRCRSTGRTLDGLRIRFRVCQDCDTTMTTLEVVVPNASFHRLNDAHRLQDWFRKRQKPSIPTQKVSIVVRVDPVMQANQTHCKRGHPRNGTTRCQTCRREYDRIWHQLHQHPPKKRMTSAERASHRQEYMRVYMARWREANRETINEYNRRWMAEYRAKKRAA